MENVEPAYSSGSSLRVRARAARLFGLAGNFRQALGVGVAQHRRDEPAAFSGHRHSQMDAIVVANRLTLERRVHLRVLAQRRGTGFQDNVVVAELQLGVEQVGGLAQFLGALHVHFNGEIEMRHGAFALHQARGDDLAHGAERLVGVFRTRGRRRWATRQERTGAREGAGVATAAARRSGHGSMRGAALDVLPNDPSIGAGSGDVGKLQAHFLRHALGQWRSQQAAAHGRTW